MKLSPKARRELGLILLFLGAAAFLAILLGGERGLWQLQQYRRQLHELQLENQRLRAQQRLYLRRIQRLKSDPKEIERIARERYNYARPGDIIVTFTPEETP